MRVAVFGGSFDPPHVAHVLAATYVLSTGGFERVVVVPVFAHAFDKRLTDFDHRSRMAELAMAPLGAVSVSRIESELPSPSRTLHTLERLRRDQPEWHLRLLIGADVLLETASWHAWDEVCRLAPPFVVGRVGVSHPEAPVPVLPDVSSTRVRELLAQRDDPAARRELEQLVPRAVLAYLDEHGLYR